MATPHHLLRHYWEVYNGNGPYLLLVHGFLSSRGQWLPNLEALSSVTTPVVVELFGHGRSPSPESIRAYHPEEYVKSFERIRRQLGVSKWFICGQSLGASLTLRYALRHPEVVSAQVFTNTIAGLAEPTSLSNKYVNHYAKELLKGDPKILETLPMHPVHARFLREDVQSVLIEDSANADLLGIANTLQFTMPEVSVRNEIHHNRVPSLLICGKWEKRFTIFRNFAKENMPHLNIIDLDAGHAVNVGAADKFNEAVIHFIHEHS
jgi:2-succinyl-6-hydroxy-2,4-cyclohexadiene-1-carboxylate synthase